MWQECAERKEDEYRLLFVITIMQTELSFCYKCLGKGLYK